jgi:sigma-B regulation protein RsbU (phosphoserine phosphatase)
MEDVCKQILAKTAETLKVNKASIMKLDPNRKTLKIVAALGLPRGVSENACVKIGEGISGRVFKLKKPMLIKDVRALGMMPKKRYSTFSLMSAPVTCFPMKVGKNPIGVINVTDRKGGRPFSKEDLNLLTTIANQTAAYLHICDLAESARESEHIRQELELAKTIQERLLPRRAPRFEGFQVAGFCMTAEKVGGDYFDFIEAQGIPPSAVVADVAGHSVSAAMMMSAFRSALKSGWGLSMFSPGLVAERMNAQLFEDLSAAEQFISMVYLQVLSSGDQSKTTVKYTTAGHYPPLILHGSSFTSHSTMDVLLGVERFADYHEKKVDIYPEDLILLYTDGLVDAKNELDQKFGVERVKEFLKKNRDKDSERIAEDLCLAVKKFTGRRKLSDDVTVVVLKKE